MSPAALCCPPTKEGSWLAANAWWEAHQREIDAASAPADGGLGERIRGAIEAEQGEPFANPGEFWTAMADVVGSNRTMPGIDVAILGADRLRDLRERTKALLEPATDRPDRTVGYWIEQSLDQLRASVAVGTMSAGRLDGYLRDVRAFRDWIGSAAGIESITAATVDGFFASLSQRLVAGSAAATLQNQLMTGKQFVGW